MTGLTPVPRVVFQSCTAPAMEPWSVRLTDGISSSAARATRSGTRHAPSRIEYSEWTCRWTNSAVFEAVAIAEEPVYAGVQTGLRTAAICGRRGDCPADERGRSAYGARPRSDRDSSRRASRGERRNDQGRAADAHAHASRPALVAGPGCSETRRRRVLQRGG